MYYEEKFNSSFSGIKLLLEDDETINFKFWGRLDSSGFYKWHLKGAFVITDKHFYFSGIPTGRSSLSGIAHSTNVIIIPLNSIKQLIDKKKGIIIVTDTLQLVSLISMVKSAKLYGNVRKNELIKDDQPNKMKKIVLVMEPGPKEPKKDFLNRTHELFAFLLDYTNL